MSSKIPSPTVIQPWLQKSYHKHESPSSSSVNTAYNSKSNQMSKLSDYEIINQLGQGTFGIVTKAKQKTSGKLVALKKLIIHDKKEGFPITAFREITIMKKLKNLNVLQIVDMIHENNFFYTVSPYISSDLNGLLNNPRIKLKISQIKCLINQILKGINYIHSKGYLHRDIKTANILLDYYGIAKIADFGLARIYHGDPPSTPNSPPGGGKYEYTGLVVTRWYRPPELLLGDRKYTTSVDMWGIGCVFGELFLKKPILEGNSDIHQAEIIFKLLGSPTQENFPNCHIINRNQIDLKTNYPRTLESIYSEFMSPDAIELLSGLLNLDPNKRFNALKALHSDFFKSYPPACDTLELSNLEESHESDIKRFKDEKQGNENNSNGINKNKFMADKSSIPPPGIPSLNQTSRFRNNESLNHSRYGAEIPAFMDHSSSYKHSEYRQPPIKRDVYVPSNQKFDSYQDGSLSFNDQRYNSRKSSRFPDGDDYYYSNQTYRAERLRDKYTDDIYYSESRPTAQVRRDDRVRVDDYYTSTKSGYSSFIPHNGGSKGEGTDLVETNRKDKELYSSQAHSKDLYGTNDVENKGGLTALKNMLLMRGKRNVDADGHKEKHDVKKSKKE